MKAEKEEKKKELLAIKTDQKYEIKTLKFMKEKFCLKIYDTQLKKGQTIDI